MTVMEERENWFDLANPLILISFLVASIILVFIGNWLAALVVFLCGIFWGILSFRVVDPVFAGLIIRLGKRVIASETIQYFRIEDGKKVGITDEEFNKPDFDPKAVGIECKVSTEYLVLKEGWVFVFPVLERIIRISLEQHEEEVNKQREGEGDEAYKARAESFTTSEGVSIFPAFVVIYRVNNPGKTIELEGGVNEKGISPTLVKMTHNFAISGARGIMAKMEITEILSREIKEKNGNTIPLGDKIKNEINNAPNFEKLGAEILAVRLLDVKFTQEAQAVLDALKEIKRQRLEKEDKIIEENQKLEVQRIATETLINKSLGELTKARNEALALNAAVAAFAGRKVEEPTTPEDGEKYARYQVGLATAKAFESATKVIIPAGEVSKVMAGLVNVFEATK